MILLQTRIICWLSGTRYFDGNDAHRNCSHGSSLFDSITHSFTLSLSLSFTLFWFSEKFFDFQMFVKTETKLNSERDSD
jgi:hypothetical protein